MALALRVASETGLQTLGTIEAEREIHQQKIGARRK